ncbi:hypothetical protein CSA37_00615 [Candidatus Fermentibacteria bacterium]|nr:MAG: hypothetical protein CSA37_09845 [Candidatus Fermentibacteria bacterium]PIE53701.1 MAG: hypothetical protein CSA37_00615 [Candidatus Fermentibacteria bacterium]
MEELLDSIIRSSKGQRIACILKQMFCFIADGTSSSISCSDEMQKDPGYSSTLECRQDSLLSSHLRFLGKLTPLLNCA